MTVLFPRPPCPNRKCYLHVQGGNRSGNIYFFQGQGIAREFLNMSGKLLLWQNVGKISMIREFWERLQLIWENSLFVPYKFNQCQLYAISILKLCGIFMRVLHLSNFGRDHSLCCSCDSFHQDGGCIWNVKVSHFNMRENYAFVREMSGRRQGIMIYQSCGNPV